MVATEASLLLHVPPDTLLDSVVVAPVFTVVVPVIVPGLVVLVTVTGTVTVDVPHAPIVVCVIIAVPVATPTTTPPLLTVAIPGLLLLHVPPPALDVSVIVLPAQTVDGPLTESVVVVDVTVTVIDVKQLGPVLYMIVVVPA